MVGGGGGGSGSRVLSGTSKGGWTGGEHSVTKVVEEDDRKNQFFKLKMTEDQFEKTTPKRRIMPS